MNKPHEPNQPSLIYLWVKQVLDQADAGHCHCQGDSCCTVFVLQPAG